MERKQEIRQPLLWASLVALGMLIGVQLDDELPGNGTRKEVRSGLDRMQDALHFIEEKYGEPVDLDSVAESMLPHLIESLDPHSYYMNRSHLNYFNEQFEGNYQGIGIEYELLGDSVYVLKVSEDSPASRAKLQFGDLIMKLDSVDVSGSRLSQKDIRSAWSATKTELDLHVFSAGRDTMLRLRKEVIKTPSVSSAHLLTEDIGYIRIDRFGAHTYADFMAELERLIKEGLKHLIIDVRDNPGGSLDQSIKIADQFVGEKGVLLAYIEGQNLKRSDFHSTANVFFKVEKVMVLVNENSVSASEVLAGILQDLGRAKIIGRRTFGKALVQETFELDRSSAINLTIGRYFLPSGRHLQRDYSDRERYDNRADVQDSPAAEGEDFIAAKDGRRLPVGQGVWPDIVVEEDTILDARSLQEIQSSVHKYLVRRGIQSTLDDPEQVSEAFLLKKGYNEALLPTIQSVVRAWYLRYRPTQIDSLKRAELDPVVRVALEYMQ